MSNLTLKKSLQSSKVNMYYYTKKYTNSYPDSTRQYYNIANSYSTYCGAMVIISYF